MAFEGLSQMNYAADKYPLTKFLHSEENVQGPKCKFLLMKREKRNMRNRHHQQKPIMMAWENNTTLQQYKTTFIPSTQKYLSS